MNKLLLLLFIAITVQTVGASEEQIKLDAKHTLIITNPTNLTVKQVRGQPGWSAAVVISDKKKVSEIRVVVRPTKKAETKEKLTQKMVSEARQQLLPDSIEKEIVTKEKSGKEFSLIYFRLTDARKNTEDGKYMTQGIGISPDFVIEYLMLSKTQTEAEGEILDCLANCIVKKIE